MPVKPPTVSFDDFSKLPAERIRDSGNQGVMLGVLDKDNPRSIYNLFQYGQWKTLLDKLEHCDFNIPEKTLRQLAKTNTNTELNRLRHAFWEEYNRAQFYNDKMHPFTMGITNITTWQRFEELLKDKHCLVYILTPPPQYKVQVKEGLSHGLERVREILDLPLQDPVTGKINTQICNLIMSATKFLDARVNGAFTQKQVNYNVNENKTTIEDKTSPATQLTVEDIDKKIRELENKKKSIPAPSGIVGVPMNDITVEAIEAGDGE